VLDGPYPDTRGQLGGCLVIEAESLAAAMPWAMRRPCVETGTVELRPVLPMQE